MARDPRGKRAPHRLRRHLTFLRYPETLENHKTAWQHYNESTWLAMSQSSI